MLQLVKFALADHGLALVRVDQIACIYDDGPESSTCTLILLGGQTITVVGDMEHFIDTFSSFVGTEWSAIKERTTEPENE